MASCSVEFNRKFPVYSPGDNVEGNVKIEISDPEFKARKIRLEMIGKAYTYWEGTTKNNTKIKGGDIARVRHNCADHKGKIVYCRFETVAWKSDGKQHELPLGMHFFPFSFQLPHWAAPSFEGDLGFVRYFIKVQIDRPWKFDDKFITCFTVLPAIDLAMVEKTKLPAKAHVCEDIGVMLWRKGCVRMEIKMPKQGFLCGEHLQMEIKIDNKTSKKFKQITLKLLQRVTYTGFRDGFIHSQSQGEVTCATRLNAQIRIEERKILEDNIDIKIDKNEKLEMEQKLKLPSLTPTSKMCDIIDIEYFLKVKISTLGTFPSVVKLHLPFVIGTMHSDIDREVLGKCEYKKSVFGYSGTVLKNKDMQKYAPLYPVYRFKS